MAGGVCLQEDVLRTEYDSDCDPELFEDKTVCNMRDWMMDRVSKTVHDLLTALDLAPP